jgi:hypothetical protein
MHRLEEFLSAFTRSEWLIGFDKKAQSRLRISFRFMSSDHGPETSAYPPEAHADGAAHPQSSTTIPETALVDPAAHPQTSTAIAETATAAHAELKDRLKRAEAWTTG